MPTPSTASIHSNTVLQPGFQPSLNFWASDSILQDHLRQVVPSEQRGLLWQYLEFIGKVAATEMDELSLTADQNVPKLLKRNRWGEMVDQVAFHPAYWQLMRIAVDSRMMRVKWEPNLRELVKGSRHQFGFAIGLLYAMSESGQYCPLCMTDGVAHLIDQFCEPEDRARLLPHIYTTDSSEFYTGAMFLTEKAGGSDVGANLLTAKHLEGRTYSLHGEKWFCSNVNAQIIFALARTKPEVQGTRGLSIFLIERQRPDGSQNPLGIVRLKDKLGTRSMASGECLLDGTIGTLVGEEFQGFRIMTEMINLSRLYNSVAALAGGRRALVEAWQFLGHRVTFGKPARSHSLVRAKVWELGSLHLASFHLVWRTILAMDRAEGGDADEAELLRLLTPMAKRESAELAVFLCRESMELMGGMGYIEEMLIPKIMRDVMVLPIWEGAGNIMVLDMLRAAGKSQGLPAMLAEIRRLCAGGGEWAEMALKEADDVAKGLQALQGLERDAMEFRAKGLFERLTRCMEMALLVGYREQAPLRHDLAMQGLAQRWGWRLDREVPPSPEELEELVGWKV